MSKSLETTLNSSFKNQSSHYNIFTFINVVQTVSGLLVFQRTGMWQQYTHGDGTYKPSEQHPCSSGLWGTLIQIAMTGLFKPCSSCFSPKLFLFFHLILFAPIQFYSIALEWTFYMWNDKTLLQRFCPGYRDTRGLCITLVRVFLYFIC